jgi:lysophospholipase L1-like esterase
MNPNENPSHTPIKVTFFGDSTCVGQGVSIYQGWVTKIAKHLNDYEQKINREILVSNSSINGRTTRQALEDMPYHIQGHGVDILVVQFGLNDCNHWASDRGLPRVGLPSFVANLREIISRGERFGARRILLNNNHPTSRDKSIMPGATMTYEASNARYNAAIRELAADLPPFVLFQDIEAHFKANLDEQQPIEKFLLRDGLHLSTAGHERYYQLMYPIIQDALDAVIAEEAGA